MASGFLPDLTSSAQGEVTNSVPDHTNAVIRFPSLTPQAMAVAHERAGRKRKAAELYEAIAHTNTATRKVIAHRLVTIYTETGETNKAMQ